MKLASTDTLKALMKQRGLSCARLAQYAGCSKSFIGFLLHGDKTSCSEALADDIAAALDVPTSVLFVKHTSARSGRSINSQQRKVAA